MEYLFSFERLNVWNDSKTLVKLVYQIIERFPKEEKYALCDQLRRASISIPSNIAEGTSRISLKEQIHYIEIAFGSLMEVYCQLQLSIDLNYITANDLQEIKNLIMRISKQLSGLKESMVKRLNESHFNHKL